MTRIASLILSASASSIAFAIANEGTKAGAAAPATAETESAPETVNSAIYALTDDKQIDLIAKAFDGQRSIHPTFAEAYAKLTKISIADETQDLFGLPIAIVGYDEGTEAVDESVYDGARAVLALVGARGVKGSDGKERNSFKAVVIFPIPTLETFLNMTVEELASIPSNVREWLDKIMVKEASHVAFRNFREAATLSELMNGAKAAPKSVEEFVTASNREGSGLDTDTFDALWNSFRTMLRTQQPAVYKVLPSKPDVIKAIRSKSYAETQDDTKELEKFGVFARIASMLIEGAKLNKNKDGSAAPLDPSAIQEWLDGRDSLVLTKAAPEVKDFSALASALANW